MRVVSFRKHGQVTIFDQLLKNINWVVFHAKRIFISRSLAWKKVWHSTTKNSKHSIPSGMAALPGRFCPGYMVILCQNSQVWTRAYFERMKLKLYWNRCSQQSLERCKGPCERVVESIQRCSWTSCWIDPTMWKSLGEIQMQRGLESLERVVESNQRCENLLGKFRCKEVLKALNELLNRASDLKNEFVGRERLQVSRPASQAVAVYFLLGGHHRGPVAITIAITITTAITITITIGTRRRCSRREMAPTSNDPHRIPAHIGLPWSLGHDSWVILGLSAIQAHTSWKLANSCLQKQNAVV